MPAVLERLIHSLLQQVNDQTSQATPARNWWVSTMLGKPISGERRPCRRSPGIVPTKKMPMTRAHAGAKRAYDCQTVWKSKVGFYRLEPE